MGVGSGRYGRLGGGTTIIMALRVAKVVGDDEDEMRALGRRWRNETSGKEEPAEHAGTNAQVPSKRRRRQKI